ncbi:MAG: helix-turn-helix domain-containing protein [Clostridia bacterium]|nr:helix-turn-helix domain-containing protein [Clostridia bacterium]
MSNIRSESVDRLFQIILNLGSPEDCYAFFEDVCTIKEVQDMAQRLDAAFLLDEGMNYQEISQKVGISTATISRVSKCLKYGSGYRNAIDKAKEQAQHENQ